MVSDVREVLEHSSRVTPEGEADPRMLFYRTGIWFNDVVVEVVLDINFLKQLAEFGDPRLREVLLKRVRSYDYALGSLSGIGARMWKILQTTKKEYSVSAGENIGGPERAREFFANKKDD